MANILYLQSLASVSKDMMTRLASALRSGEYEQGRGQLEKVNGFSGRTENCCLGVLCRLAIRDGVPVEVITFGGRAEFDGTEYVLPSTVANAAGLGVNPEVYAESEDGKVFLTTLSKLNDTGWAFGQIAGIIEKNFISQEYRQHAEQDMEAPYAEPLDSWHLAGYLGTTQAT